MQQLPLLDDVYDIWYTPWWQMPLGYGTIIIVSSIIIILSAYRVKNWYNRFLLQPERQAIKQLSCLYKEISEKNKNAQVVYPVVTTVLKKYIAKRYQLTTQGATDSECIMILENISEQVNKNTYVDKEIIELFSQLMNNAQKVKFGYYEISSKQVQDDITNALLFVERTTLLYKNKNQKIAN